MQDKQPPMQRDDEQVMSLRTQQLIEHLEDAWKQSHELSLESLKGIISSLPEPYRTMSIATLADRLVNDMKLHMLDLLVTFYGKAEQEEIDTDERDETLQDILRDVSQLLLLNERLSVQSLDELLTLSNVTAGLRSLSAVDTAESAQRWLYKLPALYQNRLEQEHMMRR
jgi:hypothetical protein